MKVVFVSNYFNHHQHELSDTLYELTNHNYHFISTEPMPNNRMMLGYSNCNEPEYVLHTYESKEKFEHCQKIIDEADVVIFGSAPEKLLRNRKKDRKLVFRYSERPLKKGIEPLKYLPRLIRWRIRNPMSHPFYLLCASAYAAEDYRKFGLFVGRCYKWGYFPETVAYNDGALSNYKNNSIPVILWVGRLIDWKHPEYAVKVASRLKAAGYRFKMNIIGCGDMEEDLKKLITGSGLNDCVSMLGSMSPSDVRRNMEKANVFLFTSDKNEGWGAVLNEAMNSGCAVIASHDIGAVPFMIADGKNGLVFKSGNEDKLYEKVKYLLDNSETALQLGMNAYSTVTEVWNANNAAKRLILLSEKMLSGEKTPDMFINGPCSRARLNKH